jgi:hypothetical protein
MAYKNEKASKFAYQTIIKDKSVQEFLKQCYIPEIDELKKINFKKISKDLEDLENVYENEINKILVIDGGYQVIDISKNRFEIMKIAFYSCGIMSFDYNLLLDLNEQQTVNPNEINNIKTLYKQNFTLPVQLISLKGYSFIDSIRKSIYDIFAQKSLFYNNGEIDKDSIFIDTIKWLAFEEYLEGKGTLNVNCPVCDTEIKFEKKNNDYKNKNDVLRCKKCYENGNNTIVYITDIFGFHLKIEDNNSETIVSLLLNIFEVIMLFTSYRVIIEKKDIKAMAKFLFIKDGSLAIYDFHHKDTFVSLKIIPFLSFLFKKSIEDKKNYLSIVGIEKSGYFYSHLQKIKNMLKDKTVLIPDNDYIQKNITFENKIMGKYTNFGIKMFYHHSKGFSYVMQFPFPTLLKNKPMYEYEKFLKKPNIKYFINLKNIIEILTETKSSKYEGGIIPIILVNKQVSVSRNPGYKMLKEFTKEELFKD